MTSPEPRMQTCVCGKTFRPTVAGRYDHRTLFDHSPSIVPDDPQTRVNIALSMFQRTTVTPDRRLELIEAALLGATVQDLIDMERKH
jgi:hypothetical protein